jgi:hydrogenase maturation protease
MTVAAGPRILVVTVGNPDRADDGVGPRVAVRLEGRLPPDAALIVSGGDMLGLVETWAGREALICVDASAPMGAPGRIRRIEALTEEVPRGGPSASSHFFGLAEALALSRELGMLPRSVILYAVEAARFDLAAAMTPAVEEAVVEVAERVIAEVRRLSAAAMETAADA